MAKGIVIGIGVLILIVFTLLWNKDNLKWRRKKEVKLLDQLYLFNQRIDEYYAPHPKRPTLRINLTPRQIWELMESDDCPTFLYQYLKLMHSGDITFHWYHGAKLVRKEAKNG